MSGLDGKPFDIPRRLVWRAWKQVKANGGAAGADGVTTGMFEEDLKDSLYKVWNRMSSGAYFPPPVRAVEVPKTSGGTRVLGVPAVGDRVAQTVAARALEPRAESIFHDDSCGYRRERGALDAVGTCRQRCWERSWVIDLGIRKFFDSVPWDLVVKAVQANVTHEQRWIVLSVTRWLAAPMVMPDGRTAERDRGTPQGSAISPVLASLFMHYAFDKWLEREFPLAEFERYADDAVVHCATEQQARKVLAALEERMAEVGLQLHPDKTKIVCVPRAQEGGVGMSVGDLDRLCCCVEDEGCGPSASLFGGEASNHPLRHWLKTVVVSEWEKAHMMRQVGIGKASASESPLTCRN